MKTSEIAIIMPAYNPDPELLREAIAPLLAQTRPADLLIIDDGSQVPVSTLIESDPRITVLRLDENVGVTRARNAGLRHIVDAGYLYIACNDCDDISRENRIEIQVRRLEQEPELDVIGAMSPTYDSKGNYLFTRGTQGGEKEVRRQMFINLPFAHSTFCFRTSVVTRFGDYSVDYPAGEDYEYLFRIINGGGRVDCLDEPLATYLLNPDGITFKNWRRQITTRLKAQWRYFDPLEIMSYAGIARSLVTLSVPMRVWQTVKRTLKPAIG